MRGKKPKRPPTPPSEDEREDNFVADPTILFPNSLGQVKGRFTLRLQ